MSDWLWALVVVVLVGLWLLSRRHRPGVQLQHRGFLISDVASPAPSPEQLRQPALGPPRWTRNVGFTEFAAALGEVLREEVGSLNLERLAHDADLSVPTVKRVVNGSN